jgi:hypothetical protein
MNNISSPIAHLTDEQILKEFVKRFQCDGAILIYMEQNTEYGFGRWKTQDGKAWVKQIMNIIKKSESNIKTEPDC